MRLLHVITDPRLLYASNLHKPQWPTQQMKNMEARLCFSVCDTKNPGFRYQSASDLSDAPTTRVQRG